MFVTEMSYNIRDMTLDDCSDVCRLWEQTEEMSLEEDDSREAIAIYLRRNQGLCFVACVDGKIVGTVLCGHEGRRGMLRHPPSAVRTSRPHDGTSLLSRLQ